MKKLSVIFFLSLLFSGLNYAQPPGADLPVVRKPGSCYAKSLMSDKLVSVERKLPVSTKKGDDAESEELMIQLAPATTKWVKKKSDKPCQSKDPEDCMVWCLVEVPAQFETFYVVKDTVANPGFEWRTFKVQEVVEKGGYTALGRK